MIYPDTDRKLILNTSNVTCIFVTEMNQCFDLVFMRGDIYVPLQYKLKRSHIMQRFDSIIDSATQNFLRCTHDSGTIMAINKDLIVAVRLIDNTKDQLGVDACFRIVVTSVDGDRLLADKFKTEEDAKRGIVRFLEQKI